jgi:tetratricopeptide (TPR) repeat protein
MTRRSHTGSARATSLFVFLALSGCVPDPANPPPGTRATTTAPAAPARSPAWFGLGYNEVRLEPTAANGGASAGMRVDLIMPGQTADNAGLREGDVIVAINGTPTISAQDANKAFVAAAANVGSTQTITIIRDGRRETATATMVARPTNDGALNIEAYRTRLAPEEDAVRSANDAADAIRHYGRAYQFLTGIEARDKCDSAFIEQKVSEIIANLGDLLRRAAPPPTPSEADRYNQRAIAIMKNAKTDEDNDRASTELWRAVYEAPWIADLWLNLGLVYEKAGYVESVIVDLKRYLTLRPAAPDAAAIRQKLTELELLAEERKPWLRYAGNYDTDVVQLRGRNLTIRARIDSPTDNERRDRAGDLIARGTISGRQFDGIWMTRSAKPDVVRCFGNEFEQIARVEFQNDQLVLSAYSQNYTLSTCAITTRS